MIDSHCDPGFDLSTAICVMMIGSHCDPWFDSSGLYNLFAVLLPALCLFLFSGCFKFCCCCCCCCVVVVAAAAAAVACVCVWGGGGVARVLAACQPKYLFQNAPKTQAHT